MCIRDSFYTCPQLGPHPATVSAPKPNTKQFVTPSLDWTFICCKTVEDSPVTVLLAVAIRCFALFTCLQMLHEIWKFCMIFGHLILRKIIYIVATRCQILRLKCTKFRQYLKMSRLLSSVGIHWPWRMALWFLKLIIVLCCMYCMTLTEAQWLPNNYSSAFPYIYVDLMTLTFDLY